MKSLSSFLILFFLLVAVPGHTQVSIPPAEGGGEGDGSQPQVVVPSQEYQNKMKERTQILLTHFQIIWEKCTRTKNPPPNTFRELYQELTKFKLEAMLDTLNNKTQCTTCNVPVNMCLLSNFEDLNLFRLYLQDDDFRKLIINEHGVSESESYDVIKFFNDWVIDAQNML